MADLNDDRKKEEEEYGGFEPDDSDDESFLLEDENDYPAKLPDKFSDEPTSTEKVTASVNLPEKDSEPEEEIEPDEPIEIEPEEVLESAEEIIEETPEGIEEETSIENESVDFDDEFKKKLQADIEKSKSKREGNAELEDVEQSSEIAKQIGDDADTVVVLNDIDADRPSSAKSSEQTPPPAKQEENEESEQVNKEEKSKKKTPIWILMLYSSVATFIVTLGSVLLIWYMMGENSDTESDKDKSEIVAENKGTDPNSNKKAVEEETITEEEQKWLDSSDINHEDTLITYQEDKEFFAGLEDDFDEKNLVGDKPEDKPKKKTPEKIAEKKKDENNKPKSESKKEIQKDLAENVTPKSKAIKTKPNVKINESQFSMPQPNGPAPDTGLFIVQIYSSPSREDAESWLGQLKAQQVPNPIITEQEIKGRTWYRVRYGKFETKEAARTSALELGYSQSWIDRVK